MNDIEKAVAALRSDLQNREQSNDMHDHDSMQCSRKIRNQVLKTKVDIDFCNSGNEYKSGNSSAHAQHSSAADVAMYSDTKKKDAVDKGKGLPALMCSIPLGSLNQKGYLTPKSNRTALKQEYRRIKRPLLQNIRHNAHSTGLNNIIAVTSALTGEGKTYSAINLAMSMAIEKGRTVLLVDADVVKGSVGKLFSMNKDQAGLVDALSSDSMDLSSVIMQTNIQNLRFLPAGSKNVNASELLSSESMSSLVLEISKRYQDRIIILDCPPMLQTSEANIVVDHAGQVVFVVESGVTSKKAVVTALNEIASDKYVGVLLNKSNTRVGNNYDYRY